MRGPAGSRARRAAAAAVTAALCAAALVAGCRDGRPPLTSCLDDLRGVYTAEGPEGRRWMILDQRATLEAFPLFDDVTPLTAAGSASPAAGLEIAPRVLELSRSPDGSQVHGSMRRRYMRGTAVCIAKVPARVTACAGDAIDIVLSDPEPPLAWEPPCTWPRPGDSRRERWIRE